MPEQHPSEQPLELSQLITQLRSELSKARQTGKDEIIRFEVENVDLELEIAADEQVEGGIAAKFYVLTSHFKAHHKDTVTQRIKLQLKPVEVSKNSETGRESTKPAQISGQAKPPGNQG